MRWTHVLLMHLVTLATSHVLFPALSERHDQRYPGLLVSVMTNLIVFSRLSSRVADQDSSCMPCGNDKEIQRKRSIRTPQR